jgi:hypothetical protein
MGKLIMYLIIGASMTAGGYLSVTPGQNPFGG